MPCLWIVDRDPKRRLALARLAAAPEDTVLGTPADPLFDAAPVPDVIVLGVPGSPELELEFAHRVRARCSDATWILVAERPGLIPLRSLFDTIEAEVLGYPPSARELRVAIRRETGSDAQPVALSQRARRDALAARMSRWFADQELPDVMRALQPRLSDVHLLVCGEPGTGRGLLARYAHAFGATARGVLVHVACTPGTSAEDVAAACAARLRLTGARPVATLCLEEADSLPATVQQELSRWIEFGPPEGVAGAARLRWIGTARAPESLEPALREALGELLVRIPPLRERPGLVVRFANDTAHAWCQAHGERPRRLGEDALAVLEEYPWPGNLRELERVVSETLAAGSADPVRADDLRYDGERFAPLGIGEVGSLISAPPEEPGSAPERAAEEPVPAPARPGREPGPRPGRPGEAPVAEPPGPRVAPPFETDLDETPLDHPLRRIVGAVAHEVRNPLVTIRTFAQLLPEHYAEPEFRTRFSELVDEGVQRIETVVEGLSRLAALRAPARERPKQAVDVAEILESLLAARRDTIRARRVLVLKELDPDACVASGDAEQIGFALEALLGKTLELVPERGDVDLAASTAERGLDAHPSVRVQIRARGPRDAEIRPGLGVEGLSLSENTLEYAVAEAIVRSQGGRLELESMGDETRIRLDLPAA